jgi:hypothetical protein
MPMPIDNLKGRRFGRLIVLSLAETRRGHARWLCQCDCGKEKVVAATELKRGNTQSCGCFQMERRIEMHRIHGENKRSPEWEAWTALRKRCFNPKHKFWKDYGGRGIAVCERWNDYANFLTDMGRRPSPKHSLDRIDNEKGYEPGNCRWATKKEQAQNRRTSSGGNYASYP